MTMQFHDLNLQAVFQAYPPESKQGLLALRDLIFAEAANLPQIGPVQEVLRWGQPSYITPKRKAASTLRIGVHKSANFAIFAHCQSRIIADFSDRFPGWDRLDGNRAVLFNAASDIDPLRHGTLIRDALTYHLKPSERPPL